MYIVHSRQVCDPSSKDSKVKDIQEIKYFHCYQTLNYTNFICQHYIIYAFRHLLIKLKSECFRLF